MGDRLLVILGGSQGAVALNQWVKQNLDGLSNEGISRLLYHRMKTIVQALCNWKEQVEKESPVASYPLRMR